MRITGPESQRSWNGIPNFLQLLFIYQRLGLHNDVYSPSSLCVILEFDSLSGQEEGQKIKLNYLIHVLQ